MIQQYENLLRQIISISIGEGDETNFKVSPGRLEKWKEKREEEKNKYNGVLREKRIIYYSDFYDLETIIVKNWEMFKEIFDEKKRFEVLFKEVETFRNTVAHGRVLLPYQEQLINGILGDLKTKIILYHNKSMKAEDYFINILKISDNLGNIWDKNSPSKIGLVTESILRENDLINIIVDAYDPKGRKINYKISSGNFSINNESGRFSITIKKEMINPMTFFYITVSTEESDYKNYDSASMAYIILP